MKVLYKMGGLFYLLSQEKSILSVWWTRSSSPSPGLGDFMHHFKNSVHNGGPLSEVSCKKRVPVAFCHAWHSSLGPLLTRLTCCPFIECPLWTSSPLLLVDNGLLYGGHWASRSVLRLWSLLARQGWLLETICGTSFRYKEALPWFSLNDDEEGRLGSGLEWDVLDGVVDTHNQCVSGGKVVSVQVWTVVYFMRINVH